MPAITAMPSALVQLNDCTQGLLHLTPNGITLRNLLSLGQLLHFLDMNTAEKNITIKINCRRG